MSKIFISSILLALVALSYQEEDKGILDCLTRPCVNIPGVGKIKGTYKETQFNARQVSGFWGIPFGEDTGGANRFQPPVPKAQLNDGQDAFDAGYLKYITNWFNTMCPQPGIDLGNYYVDKFNAEFPVNETNGKLLEIMGSEDCLNLAVFTPELPTDDYNPNLPVMVYIHGGAFMMGGYIGAGPGKLLERDIVLVEIQYRLGPLGFMCLPHDDIAGNMGLLDQLLALKWINQHISAFGGDPNRVTVMGESAGSASATYHMLSPMSQPYFQQVIAESGSALSGWAFDNHPEDHAKAIAGHIQCPTNDLSQMVNCLKTEKTVKDIVMGHKSYYLNERANARMGFGGSSPCAQSHGTQQIITKNPKEYLVGTNNLSPKNILAGSNRDEGSFVLGLMYNTFVVPNNVEHDTYFLRHKFVSTILEALGLNDNSGVIYEMLSYTFFNNTDLGNWNDMMPGMVNLVGTFFIKASTYELLKYQSLHGANTFYYSFEHYGQSSLWNFLFPSSQPPIPRGVTHGDELVYLFSTGVFTLTDEDWDMAWLMINLWANFVEFGSPNSASHQITGVPVWPEWNESDLEYMVLQNEPYVARDYLTTWANPQNHVF